MRITADTNLLVRVIVRDDVGQAEIALRVLELADAVFVPLPCICEFVWILDSVYALPRDRVAKSIRALVFRANIVVDRTAVSAGLRLLDSGGDFADGVIASTGMAMGAETFVSFDRKAVTRLGQMGITARHAGEFE
jgi:predicted nucleic-acid-binding protein